MKTYRIIETQSGNDFGTYEASDEHSALEALAKDAGYSSYEEMLEITGNRGDLRVIEVLSSQ